MSSDNANVRSSELALRLGTQDDIQYYSAYLDKDRSVIKNP